MKSTRSLSTLLVVATAIAIGSATAFESTRLVPARELPVPSTASPELQAFIGAPLLTGWNTHPKSAEEWKTFVQQFADFSLKMLPGLRERLAVKVEPGE